MLPSEVYFVVLICILHCSKGIIPNKCQKQCSTFVDRQGKMSKEHLSLSMMWGDDLAALTTVCIVHV